MQYAADSISQSAGVSNDACAFLFVHQSTQAERGRLHPHNLRVLLKLSEYLLS
jgi:hypothetical protein